MTVTATASYNKINTRTHTTTTVAIIAAVGTQIWKGSTVVKTTPLFLFHDGALYKRVDVIENGNSR